MYLLFKSYFVAIIAHIFLLIAFIDLFLKIQNFRKKEIMKLTNLYSIATKDYSFSENNLSMKYSEKQLKPISL